MVETETCQVRAAVAAYRKKVQPDPEQIVTTRLLAEGESREDVDRARYEAMRARFPQAVSPEGRSGS